MNFRALCVLSLGLALLTACASETAPAATEAPVTQAVAQPGLLTAPTLEPTLAPTEPLPTQMEVSLPFELISTAFSQGEPIPPRYSCKGEDISPSLAWGDPPEGTQSFVLIMDDPDAPGGTWIHWIVFNIPADVRELPENMPAGMKFGDVAVSFGANSWGRAEYGGPCPPSGTHRYFFKLYALDTTLALEPGARSKVLEAVEAHSLAKAELMGTFSR